METLTEFAAVPSDAAIALRPPFQVDPGTAQKSQRNCAQRESGESVRVRRKQVKHDDTSTRQSDD